MTVVSRSILPVPHFAQRSGPEAERIGVRFAIVVACCSRFEPANNTQTCTRGASTQFNRWKPIEDYAQSAEGLAVPELRALSTIWQEQMVASHGRLRPSCLSEQVGSRQLRTRHPRMRPYLACKRTTGPVRLQLLPFASVPEKFVCAVWAVDAELHQRVRSVEDPFAAIRNDGFVRAVTAPSNMSTRSVTVTATPPTSRTTWS